MSMHFVYAKNLLSMAAHLSVGTESAYVGDFRAHNLKLKAFCPQYGIIAAQASDVCF